MPRLRPLLLVVLACQPLPGDPTTGGTSSTGNSGQTETGGQSETGSPTETGATTETGSVDPTTGAVLDTTTDATTTTGPPPPDSTTCDFICDPTEGPTGVECDPFAQDCPPGQKCSAYASGGGSSWNALKCVPVAEDPKQPGDTCTAEGGGTSGIDDCDLGAYCWDVDENNTGTCVALCHGSPDSPTCDDPAKTCAIYNEGVLNLCLDSCDPLTQDCPMADDLCIANNGAAGFICVLDASGEEGQQHDPCEYANACDPGLYCANSTAANECDPAASGCCEPFCDLTDPDADANCGGAGQICTAFFEEGTAPPGLENVGICTLP